MNLASWMDHRLAEFESTAKQTDIQQAAPVRHLLPFQLRRKCRVLHQLPALFLLQQPILDRQLPVILEMTTMVLERMNKMLHLLRRLIRHNARLVPRRSFHRAPLQWHHQRRCRLSSRHLPCHLRHRLPCHLKLRQPNPSHREMHLKSRKVEQVSSWR